jgi:hypothetical protein
MNSYVMDISNPEKRKETNKTVENLLEEHIKVSDKIEIYGSLAIVVLLLSVVVFLGSVYLEADFTIPLIVMLLLSFMFIIFYKKVDKKINELAEIKMKLLISLKQEGIIVERSRDEISFPRNIIISQAKNNEPFFIENERIDTVKLLLENPNIQSITGRKIYYEILKIHSKHQKIINELCKEKEYVKVVYEN